METTVIAPPTFDVLKNPWTCNSCQQEQPAPGPTNLVCAACEGRRVIARRGKALRVLHERLTWSSGIPPRFLNPAWTLPEWMGRYLDCTRGLCLTGLAGIGKTTALCLLAREACVARVVE